MRIDDFRNPPTEYRAVTFWSWNGKLTPEETRRQVRDMAEHGLGGGFMHARSGLHTRYLSDEWFANCRAAVEEGQQVGFFPWLYDEDRWPSGSCGGQTAAAHPDFRCRILMMERDGECGGYVDFGDDGALDDAQRIPLGNFSISHGAEGVVEYAPAAADASGPNVSRFTCLVLPPSDWENGGCYPDLMHNGAVAEYLRNTYEVYESHMGEHFGKTVPGCFSDEPLLHRHFPWSARMIEEFRARRGYDLLEKLPALFCPASDARAVRHDYWKTVLELFRESYFKQIGEWCESRDMAFTGHLMGENDLHLQLGFAGAAMPHYAHMTIPGIDLLTERIVETVTVKQASSVCNQLGKPRMLSETYGCTGNNFSFEGQKWISDWQMALGVNFLCQHLTFYTMKNGAKRDYPPSYGYQSPWWRHYRHVADYQTRLCYALSQGRAQRDILLIHPITSVWCDYDVLHATRTGFMGCGVSRPTELLNETMRSLLQAHRDFDLGDETLLSEYGRVDGDAFVVGQARYKTVIVPICSNLESSTLALLEEFLDAGGQVVWLVEAPQFVDGISVVAWPSTLDGRPSERVAQLAKDRRVRRASREKRELAEVLDALLPRQISITHADSGKEAGDVLYQKRCVDDGSVFFLVNTNRDTGARLRIHTPETGAWEIWNAEDGSATPLPARNGNAGSSLALELAPAGSALLRCTPGGAPQAVSPACDTVDAEEVVSPADAWAFERTAPNSLILDRCAWRVNDEPYGEPDFLMDAQEVWRARFGFFAVRTMAREIQPWKQALNPDNSKVVAQVALRYTFQVDVPPATETRLVLEDRGETEIRINGQPVSAPADGWFMDRAFETVPIGAFLTTGENVIELRFDLYAMRIVEDIYLVGDFGVNHETHALIAEPATLRPGDWTTQGYPFYTDAMIYKATFDLEAPCPCHIELERFEGAAAAVHVNGGKAGVLGWRPYTCAITPFVKSGRNALGVEVVGSPRNLMGPRHSAHKHPFATGPVEMADTSEAGYHLTPAGLYGNVRLRKLRSPEAAPPPQ